MEQKRHSTKKIHRAWSIYDWANSAYNLVITSTIFPVYYIQITTDKTAAQPDLVTFFGWKLVNSALLSYALAAAYLFIAILSPILSSVADYQGSKKRFMQLFSLIGSLACCCLFFFYPGRTEYGILLSIIAAIGYCGSLVFYNAYLPEIALPEQRDRLSAQGYAYGYIGSVLLQIVCFAFLFIPFDDGTFAARLSFLLVGIWWFGFAQITFHYLPSGRPLTKDTGKHWLTGGFHELKKVAGQIRHLGGLKTYLLAFFFYSMGVQTVMLAAAEFGSKEIKKQVDGHWVAIEATDLILIILLIQLVAIAGAFVMARFAKRYGNIKVLMCTVSIWVLICVSAYFTYTLTEFYLVAIFVGLVMGGIQSLSRSTYAKLMPRTRDTTSYFSFYDVMEKIAIVIGMFTFGFLENLTGDMRNSIIALGIFFLLGLLLLVRAQQTVGRPARIAA